MNHIKRILKLTYYHMRSRYRKTLAGFLWVVANPIINFSVQALVFKAILKINVDDYPAFLLSGLMPWFFISQSVTNLASCLVTSRELLLGFKFNPLNIVASQVLDNFFNYLIATVLIMIGLLALGLISLSPIQLFLFIANSFVLLPFVLLVTAIVSFLHVFYRDIQFVASFVMNLAFFLTPIFYTIDYVDPAYQWIFNLNIFYPMISLFQASIHTLDFTLWAKKLLVCLSLTVALGGLLTLLIKKKMKDFYINV